MPPGGAGARRQRVRRHQEYEQGEQAVGLLGSGEEKGGYQQPGDSTTGDGSAGNPPAATGGTGRALVAGARCLSGGANTGVNGGESGSAIGTRVPRRSAQRQGQKAGHQQ